LDAVVAGTIFRRLTASEPLRARNEPY